MNRRLLLVYPKFGLSGSLVRHMPLSLLYASIEAIRQGYEVDLLDVRLHPSDWRSRLRMLMTDSTVMVGVSVMTGTPIQSALDISRFVKEIAANMPVVWGGPHALFNAEDILTEPSVDYVVRGYGAKPLAGLAQVLAGSPGARPLESIAGLTYRKGDGIVHVPIEPDFEYVDYRAIPYDLIRDALDQYGQLDQKQRTFSLYSVMGCPYRCAFCSSPVQYRDFPRKYVPYSVADIVNHIALVQEKYGADYIYFIDDDSFVMLDHVEAIIDELRRRKLNIRIGFRGARINEIIKMSDAYLEKLAAAGTNIMHIGAESGSQRLLDLIRKNCTVEDIVAVNRKMARHPEILAAYNWILGLPGETVEDLRRTQKLMLRIIDENPRAILFTPNTFMPLPGSELYDLAFKYGYRKPRRMEDWVSIEIEGEYRSPWITSELAAMINMMRVTSYFVDNKIRKVETGNTWKFRLARWIGGWYRPIARWRLRTGSVRFLIEHWLFQRVAAWMQK